MPPSRGDAPASTTAVALVGQPPLAIPTPALAAGASTRVTFTAPPCARHSLVTVTLDATNVVGEALEEAAVTRPCPDRVVT